MHRKCLITMVITRAVMITTTMTTTVPMIVVITAIVIIQRFIMMVLRLANVCACMCFTGQENNAPEAETTALKLPLTGCRVQSARCARS